MPISYLVRAGQASEIFYHATRRRPQVKDVPQHRPVIASVVFDLDGVLVDSEGVWEEVRRAFVTEGGGRWMPDTQRRLMGMSTGEWARYLSQELGVRMAPD